MAEFDKIRPKNWIYRFLGLFTAVYVGFQLVVFHLGEADIPEELVYFWMFSLFSYAVLKESFRWAGVKTHNVRGEFFAALIIAAFFWMEIYNTVNCWLYGAPHRALPNGYFKSTIESLALLVAGILSALKFHCKNNHREKVANTGGKTNLPETKETSVWLG